MSNDPWSLAEISAAILSYNSDRSQSAKLTPKDERAPSKNGPALELAWVGKMRRHDDQKKGSEYWPIR
jgi:hypothetical protein